MSNFFYKYSDYSLFQKAFRETEGEEVVVDILSTDESLKKDEVIADKHVVRKDNRFSQESSFNRFFGPRKNFNRHIDMKDFSSWKNKNYRETEKQLNESSNDKFKFSFSDFLNERSGEKVYNDADENKKNNQKAINELSSDDSTFKRFSLNDYMRRLEERTRVNSQTRDNEDLIETIGEDTQEIIPDASQDENFNEFGSEVSFDKIVDSGDTKGDRFSVDRSELDAMQSRLDEIRAETDEINSMIADDEEETEEFNFETFEDDENYEEDSSEGDLDFDSEEIGEESTEETEETNEEESTEATEGTNEEEIVEEIDETEEKVDNKEKESKDDENKSEVGGDPVIVIGGGTNKQADETTKIDDKNKTESDSQSGEIIVSGDSGSASDGNVSADSKDKQPNDNSSNNQTNKTTTKTSDESGNVNVVTEAGTDKKSDDETVGVTEKSKEIISLIEKNDKEKQEIEKQLKQAEKEKISAMKSYEHRLKELEQSIINKDKQNQKRVLLEKIKNDNKLTEVKTEFKTREEEIRRLEKEAALKMKIGALLKKELKNNLSISNLEMNNKLLEISSLISQEKEREKANKRKRPATGPRKKKRKIDSDIIGGIDFE